MKTFLLVVDIQKGFIVEGANDGAKARIDELLRGGIFDCVISTVYRNYPGSHISRLIGWNHLIEKEEQAVVGEAAVRSDHFLYKDIYSAYGGELTDILCRENGGVLPECVFVCGVDTECCVLMTAAELFEAGIRPIVLSRYCGASGGDEAHLAGIRSMGSLVGRNNIYPELIGSREDVLLALTRALDVKNNDYTSRQTKAARVAAALKERGWHIAFAESCTGGLAAAALVDVADASRVLEESFVTYSNRAKTKYLGVKTESLEKWGAVSQQVALEMAAGAAAASGAQVGVGISGIAGPGGGTAEKPVGMVCFGFVIGGESFSVTKQFGDLGRNMVRQSSVDFVYDTLLAHLEC